VISLLELGAGFGRDFSGRDNIYLQGALYGLGKAEIEQQLERIIAFSELGAFIDVPVKTYSTGMYVRLGFSIAAHLDADVLLIDEVLAVGDEAFQRKCLRRISERIASGTTVVLVSHDPSSVERVCERVVVLDAGRVVFDGPTAEGLLEYHRLMGTEQGGGESLRPAGSGTLRISELELRDAAARTSSVFRSGAALQLLVSVRATEQVARGTLRLELRDQSGATIFRTSTEFEPVADGTARLAFEIADLPLLGGDYDLVLGASEDPSDPRLERTVRFAVQREPGSQGIVDVRGEWRAMAPVQEVR
jgi:ABC-type multidrug transport system ATPase subunit